MKTKTVIILIAGGLAALSANAATYTSDFSGLADGAVLDGVDGWTQSAPNLDVPPNGPAPYAYGSIIDVSTPAATVGGYYNTDAPFGGEFHASHTLSLSGGLDFSMNMGITDSVGFDGGSGIVGTERNTFRVGFQSAGSEVFALVFVPEADANALTNPNNLWNVFTSTGGVLSDTSTVAIFESALYALQLSIVPDGIGGLDYIYSFTNGGVSLGGAGSTTGTGDFDELQVGLSPVGTQFGDNQLAFQGIVAAVPEPSSLLLVGTAIGGYALRRRRQIA